MKKIMYKLLTLLIITFDIFGFQFMLLKIFLLSFIKIFSLITEIFALKIIGSIEINILDAWVLGGEII